MNDMHICNQVNAVRLCGLCHTTTCRPASLVPRCAPRLAIQLALVPHHLRVTLPSLYASRTQLLKPTETIDETPAVPPVDDPQFFLPVEPALLPAFRLKHGITKHSVSFTLGHVFEDLFNARPDIQLHLKSLSIVRGGPACTWHPKCTATVNGFSIAVPDEVLPHIAPHPCRVPCIAPHNSQAS